MICWMEEHLNGGSLDGVEVIISRNGPVHQVCILHGMQVVQIELQSFSGHTCAQRSHAVHAPQWFVMSCLQQRLNRDPGVA